MDVMDKMDSYDRYDSGPAKYNNINLADEKELQQVDKGFSELPSGNERNFQHLFTSEKEGDITTFDFDMFKYEMPDGYFHSKEEIKLVEKYLINERNFMKHQHVDLENQKLLES